jgi:hypothetical protein
LMLEVSEHNVRSSWHQLRTGIVNEAANGLSIRAPYPPESLPHALSRTYVISPTTIIVGVCLRHGKVRRGLDWTWCHQEWHVSYHASSGHRARVMLETSWFQASLASSARSLSLAKGHEARIIVGCPLARSLAWCPVGKKDNMVVDEAVKVRRRHKYTKARLLAYYQHHKYIYHLNRSYG